MLYWIVKAVLKPLLKSIYKFRVEGLENVPRRGPAIIAANHVSFLDSFFIPLAINRRKVTYLAKAEYFKSWKTAWFFRMVGQIPIERGGGRRSTQALDTGLEVLKEGKLLGIYPEGTRSPDGRLHRARTGVSRMALQAGVPVIPCGISGTDEVMPKDARWPRLRGRPEVVVRFGMPLDFSRYRGKERDRMALRSVADELMYEIMELSGQQYVNEYATSTAGARSRAEGPGEDIRLSDEVMAG